MALKEKTPEILHGALRQYGFVVGFDYDKIVEIVTLMQKIIKAQSQLLITYRTGGKPPGWVFDVLDKGRKAGLNI